MKMNRDRKEIYLMVLDKTLTEVFGKTATDIIYNYLEERCNIRKEEIPFKLEEFKTELKKIIGNASRIVEEKIDENLSKIKEEENNEGDHC